MQSATFRDLSKTEVFNIIYNLIKEQNENFIISIGTDSQNFEDTKIVTAISVYKKNSGGIFFFDINYIKKITNVRQKIYQETTTSLNLAKELNNFLLHKDIDKKIEIHVDAGLSKKGKTFDLIKEISGWIEAENFTCIIKPYSYCASCIANKISK